MTTRPYQAAEERKHLPQEVSSNFLLHLDTIQLGNSEVKV